MGVVETEKNLRMTVFEKQSGGHVWKKNFAKKKRFRLIHVSEFTKTLGLFRQPFFASKIATWESGFWGL